MDTALNQPGSVRLLSVLFFCSEEEKGSIADCRRNAAAYGPAAAPDTALSQPGSVRLLSVLFSSSEEEKGSIADCRRNAAEIASRTLSKQV